VIEITRIYHFSAAHRLVSPRLDAAANAGLYGPCARPHGHNYYVEVTVAGAPDPLTGMAVDLGEVGATVRDRLLQHVDHHTLEAAPPLAGVITTGEGLAKAFWDILVPVLGPGALRRVRVVETAKNRFEYRGEAA
jgi:6-pyruvoyltetrahydropterin/6-carboxytetrahydropterin synthase